MTINLRRAGERYLACEAGSNRWMTFLPNDAKEPVLLGFSVLESFVEHDLAPGVGFLVHAERDEETVTYVEKGALIHGDGAGDIGRLGAGEFRRARAAKGAVHGAINRSSTERAHVFQSWLASGAKGSGPDGEQKRFPLAERRGILRLIASPDGRDGSLRLRSDVRMYSSLLDRGTHLVHPLGPGRRGWLHVVRGKVLLAEHSLGEGDGAGVADELTVSFRAQEPAEVLLFDLPYPGPWVHVVPPARS